MFEKASRLKLRFDTPKGMLSVEDLWDLPLTSQTGKANLDDIARALHAQLKNDADVSFVHKERKSDEATQLSFDLVKHVIDVKLAERDAAQQANLDKERRQRILEVIARKKDQQLDGMSLEELEKLV